MPPTEPVDVFADEHSTEVFFAFTHCIELIKAQMGALKRKFQLKTSAVSMWFLADDGADYIELLASVWCVRMLCLYRLLKAGYFND